MAIINQVTQPTEKHVSEETTPKITSVIGAKTGSSLIRFTIKLIVLIAILVGFQYGGSNQTSISSTPNTSAGINAVHFASIFSPVQPEVNSPSVFSNEQKNCIGSNDDQARLTPESKNIATTIMSIAKSEVVDESIHPEDYTPKTSEAKREAVNQRSDTSLKKKKKLKKKNLKGKNKLKKKRKKKKKKKSNNSIENEPFGSVVYTGEHFKEMDSYVASNTTATSKVYINVKPRQVEDEPARPVAQFTSLATKKETLTRKKEAKPAKTKSHLSTIKIASLQLSNIAARENVASINSSDNASSTTKQLTNISNNLTVEGTEATASASSTQESEAKPEVTSAMFNELKVRAVKEDKLLMVRFTASWCTPCKVMEEDVYTNPKVKAYMDQHFLSMKLDSDSFDGINLKQMYDVKMIPSFLVFKSNGDLAVHVKKSMTASAMLEILKEQKTKLNTLSNADALSKSENDNKGLELIVTPIAK